MRKLGSFDIGVDCYAAFKDTALAIGFEGERTRIYLAPEDLEGFVSELRAFAAQVAPAATPAPAAGAVLPADSAARKAIPLCTGCVDYFPAVIAELQGMATVDFDADDCPYTPVTESTPGMLLAALADRDYWAAASTLSSHALNMLEVELGGAPYGVKDVCARWPRALVEVARISKAGNDKHNPGQPLHHARGKSMDHADTIARHLLERGGFDGEMRHSACLAWRCMALRQEQLEAQGAPLARGARAPAPDPRDAVVEAARLVSGLNDNGEFAPAALDELANALSALDGDT